LKRTAKSERAAIPDLNKNNQRSLAHDQIDFAPPKAAVALKQHQALTSQPSASLIFRPLTAPRRELRPCF
jgi:hypothetical protein